MAQGSQPKQQTNDKSILLILRQKQEEVKEQSNEWRLLQKQIDEIVAQNYLHMLNT